MLIFWIKFQSGVTYKSIVFKTAFNVVFKSSKNDKITLASEFIFVIIWYFIGVILSEESCQN